MCGIACGGEIKRTRSVSLRPAPAFSLLPSARSSLCLSLFFSSSSSSSSSRLLLSLLGRARELWQTRYQFLTFARKRAFSLSFSILLSSSTTTSRHRFSLVGLVLCLLALSFCPPRRSRPGRRRRRDSIIIADSLISINCRARGFPMNYVRLKRKPLLKLMLHLRNSTARANR